MLVWSGRGILSVVVLIASFIILASFIPSEYAQYGISSGLFVTAAFSWFMGKKWNEEEGRVFIDKASGQEVLLKPNHSLFWIKMQYWGFIFGGLGLIILVQAIRG